MHNFAPEPPGYLVELLESGTLKPSKALDIGCGTGYYSLYLASKGFDVTGVDLSPSAIAIARDKAAVCRSKVGFIHLDMRGDVSSLDGGFDYQRVIGKEIVEKLKNDS